MPDPMKLQVGDRVRFVDLPEEWQDPQYTVLPESVEFMEAMIARSWPSRVYEVDEFGTPWVAVRLRKDGEIEHHTWGILERHRLASREAANEIECRLCHQPTPIRNIVCPDRGSRPPAGDPRLLTG